MIQKNQEGLNRLNQLLDMLLVFGSYVFSSWFWLNYLEGDREKADELVAALVADKFVDDSRYASAFAREKASLQGWGPIKIRFQLRAKGISDSVISAALEEIDADKASARLQKLLENKWHSLQDDPQGRLKLFKFALTRGYEYEEIDPIVRIITSPK